MTKLLEKGDFYEKSVNGKIIKLSQFPNMNTLLREKNAEFQPWKGNVITGLTTEKAIFLSLKKIVTKEYDDAAFDIFDEKRETDWKGSDETKAEHCSQKIALEYTEDPELGIQIWQDPADAKSPSECAKALKDVGISCSKIKDHSKRSYETCLPYYKNCLGTTVQKECTKEVFKEECTAGNDLTSTENSAKCKTHNEKCEADDGTFKECTGLLRMLGPVCADADLMKKQTDSLKKTCDAFYKICALEMCDIMDGKPSQAETPKFLEIEATLKDPGVCSGVEGELAFPCQTTLTFSTLTFFFHFFSSHFILLTLKVVIGTRKLATAKRD